MANRVVPFERKFTKPLTRMGKKEYPQIGISLPTAVSRVLIDNGFTHVECLILDDGRIVLTPTRTDPRAGDPPPAAWKKVGL